MNSIMDTIFINSVNSKTSDPYRLLLNLSDRTNLKEVINILLYQTLALLYMKKYKKVIQKY